MRLIIVPSDTFCSIDGVGYDGVDMSSVAPNIHAVQWFDVEGWIEFKETLNGKPENEKITSIQQFQPVIDSWQQIDYIHKNPPPPPPPTAEENKRTAQILLQQTDWTQIPSVSNPLESEPYLLNSEEFAVYRNEIRQIVLNPVSGYIDFPVQPDSKWSS